MFWINIQELLNVSSKYYLNDFEFFIHTKDIKMSIAVRSIPIIEDKYF